MNCSQYLKVASISELHHNAEGFVLGVEEGLLIRYYELVRDGGQQSDLVEGVLLLLFLQVVQFYLHPNRRTFFKA